MILDHACQGRDNGGRRTANAIQIPITTHGDRTTKSPSRGKTPPALAALVVSVPGDTGAFFGQRISNPRRDSSLSDVRRCRRTHDRSRQCRPGTRPTPIPTNRGRHARGGSARQRPRSAGSSATRSSPRSNASHSWLSDSMPPGSGQAIPMTATGITGVSPTSVHLFSSHETRSSVDPDERERIPRTLPPC